MAKTRDFYSKLGIQPNKGYDKSNELTSFLFGTAEFIIHFFQHDSLQKAMEGEMADLSKGNEIIFTLWADSKEETNQWAKDVHAAGGRLFGEPKEFGEGYYGFVFADPDGHKFNVFHM
ncbi:MAG: VOC family protein [Bacteroidota bacterium]